MVDPMAEIEHGSPPYLPMVVTVEVWTVAADSSGIWLVNGEDGPWPSSPVPRGGHPQDMVELELMRRQALADAVLLHSTSWRPDGNLVITYLAALKSDDVVLADWPDARPVSPRVADMVGPPATHGPVEPPMLVRQWDVLLHALRHLSFLLETDATVAEALGEMWTQHLASFEPAIACMYGQPYQLYRDESEGQ